MWSFALGRLIPTVQALVPKVATTGGFDGSHTQTRKWLKYRFLVRIGVLQCAFWVSKIEVRGGIEQGLADYTLGPPRPQSSAFFAEFVYSLHE